MPYIQWYLRPRIDKVVASLLPEQMTVGELNYTLTRIVLRSLPDRPRYADYNTAIGLLECVKLELYRQQVAAYEDEAKDANGSIAA